MISWLAVGAPWWWREVRRPRRPELWGSRWPPSAQGEAGRGRGRRARARGKRRRRLLQGRASPRTSLKCHCPAAILVATRGWRLEIFLRSKACHAPIAGLPIPAAGCLVCAPRDCALVPYTHTWCRTARRLAPQPETDRDHPQGRCVVWGRREAPPAIPWRRRSESAHLGAPKRGLGFVTTPRPRHPGLSAAPAPHSRPLPACQRRKEPCRPSCTRRRARWAAPGAQRVRERHCGCRRQRARALQAGFRAPTRSRAPPRKSARP